jgi:hypothetical protein
MSARSPAPLPRSGALDEAPTTTESQSRFTAAATAAWGSHRTRCQCCCWRTNGAYRATADAGGAVVLYYSCMYVRYDPIDIFMSSYGVIPQRCYYIVSNAWGVQLVVPFALDWEVFGSRVDCLCDYPQRLWCNYSLKMKPKGGLRKVKSIFFNTLINTKFASNQRTGFALQRPRRVISLSQAVRPIVLPTAFRSQSASNE